MRLAANFIDSPVRGDCKREEAGCVTSVRFLMIPGLLVDRVEDFAPTFLHECRASCHEEPSLVQNACGLGACHVLPALRAQSRRGPFALPAMCFHLAFAREISISAQ